MSYLTVASIIYLILQPSIACVFLKIPDGIIKGRLDSSQAQKFYAFQQIPYAAPPIQQLRFQPPQPVQPWAGVLDTTKNTKICYQVNENKATETEDCLYLNVYTPELPSKNTQPSLPVLVFIHGGGYIIGSSIYEELGPHYLIQKNIIVVTLNYRLGVFGFLSTQDDVVPGNNGLKDQLSALEWVNKNIHYFGGDPRRVTISGQSAGASSVGYHLLNPKSSRLFRAAILESSSCINAFGFQRNARLYATKTATVLDPNITDSSSSQEIFATLRTADAKLLDLATENVTVETYDNVQLFQGYYYAPVLEEESEDSFITRKMFEMLTSGEAAKVPILLGINSEESLSQTTDLAFLKGLMSLYDNDLGALVPNDMNIKTQEMKALAGSEIRKIYSGNMLLQDVPSAGIKYMSDTTFTRAVIKHAKVQSVYSNVYFYQFSYDGLMGNVSIIVNGTDRVGHNEELAYLWRIRNDMFDNYNLQIFPESDLLTRQRLVTLWTNFVKSLNPTPRAEELFQNILWPTVNSSFPYLNIAENLDVKFDPKIETFPKWDALYAGYGSPPFDTY